MEKGQYDPYYRDFPANVVPVRTPFTRPGRHDAGHVFIYMTNLGKRWSLLLDKACADSVFAEARQHIPRSISQFWLVEKRYSTHKLRVRSFSNHPRSNTPFARKDSPAEMDLRARPGRLLVVLREPAQYCTPQGDVLSYHLQETDAIAAAESYTRRHHRRAIVGLLLWDEMWL